VQPRNELNIFADSTGEDGALGVVVGVDQQIAIAIKASGDAGVATLLWNLHPLATYPA